jgi:hypothetical protein
MQRGGVREVRTGRTPAQHPQRKRQRPQQRWEEKEEEEEQVVVVVVVVVLEEGLHLLVLGALLVVRPALLLQHPRQPSRGVEEGGGDHQHPLPWEEEVVDTGEGEGGLFPCRLLLRRHLEAWSRGYWAPGSVCSYALISGFGALLLYLLL